MKDKVIQLIKAYTDTFFISPIEHNKSIIILIFNYAPFELLNKKDYAQIDAYYFVSNASYHKAKQLADELKEIGIRVNYKFDLNYKKLAEINSFAGVGKNTLCYLNDFGSRFVMQAIEIEGAFEYLPTNTKLQPQCENCSLCKNACPTGAISDSGFDASKCLRHLQEAGEYITNKDAKSMQNKLLGCDICQAVCPYNKNQAKVAVSEELKSILKIENLLEIALDDKKIKQTFTSKLGKNYAKQKMILPTLLIVAGNSKNQNLINKLATIKNNDNELTVKNSIRALSNLRGDKKP